MGIRKIKQADFIKTMTDGGRMERVGSKIVKIDTYQVYTKSGSLKCQVRIETEATNQPEMK